MPAQKYKADRSGRRKIQNLYGGLCIYISDKAGQDRRKPGGTEGKGCCTYRRNKMEDRNSISVYQRSCYGRRYGSCCGSCGLFRTGVETDSRRPKEIF